MKRILTITLSILTLFSMSFLLENQALRHATAETKAKAKIKIDDKVRSQIDKVFAELLVKSNKTIQTLVRMGKKSTKEIDTYIEEMKQRTARRSRYLQRRMERSLKRHKNQLRKKSEKVDLVVSEVPKNPKARADLKAAIAVDFDKQFKPISLSWTTTIKKALGLANKTKYEMQRQEKLQLLDEHAKEVREYIKRATQRTQLGLRLTIRGARATLQREQNKDTKNNKEGVKNKENKEDRNKEDKEDKEDKQ